MSKRLDKEHIDKVIHFIEGEMNGAWTYDNKALSDIASKAWRAYYRLSMGNEIVGYSDYVSPLVFQHVNQIRAYCLSAFQRAIGPMIKFTPKDKADAKAAELATQFVDYIFRRELEGEEKLDEAAFNGSLLQFVMARVSIKEVKGKDTETIQATNEDEIFKFLAVNENTTVESKKINDDGTFTVVFARETVSKELDLHVVPNEEVFVSSNALNVEKNATVVARLTPMTISELMTNYPDAPKLNGEPDDRGFWENLSSSFGNYVEDREWYARWADSTENIYYRHEQTSSEVGLGDRTIFVVDSESFIDIDDVGDRQLHHIVFAAGKLLHVERDIDERSFVSGSLLPISGKWMGYSIYQVLKHEMAEETANTRAFTDASLNASHSNFIIDPKQIVADDAINSRPGKIWRRRPIKHSTNIPAVEVIKQADASQHNLQAAEMFKRTAAQITGAGMFEGHTPDDLSNVDLSTESVKVFENNSNLLLTYMSNNFAKFVIRLFIKIHNVASMGDADPTMVPNGEEFDEVLPRDMGIRTDAYADIKLSLNDESEKFNNARNVLATITQMKANPVTSGVISPNAAYEAIKEVLKCSGVIDCSKYLMPAEEMTEIMKNPEIQQMIKGQVDEAIKMSDVEKKKSEADLNYAKIEEMGVKLEQKDEDLDHKKDKDAANHSLSVEELNFEKDKAGFDVVLTDKALKQKGDTSIKVGK